MEVVGMVKKIWRKSEHVLSAIVMVALAVMGLVSVVWMLRDKGKLETVAFVDKHGKLTYYKQNAAQDAGNDMSIIVGSRICDYFMDTFGEREGMRKFGAWYQAEEFRRAKDGRQEMVIYLGAEN